MDEETRELIKNLLKEEKTELAEMIIKADYYYSQPMLIRVIDGVTDNFKNFFRHFVFWKKR